MTMQTTTLIILGAVLIAIAATLGQFLADWGPIAARIAE